MGKDSRTLRSALVPFNAVPWPDWQDHVAGMLLVTLAINHGVTTTHHAKVWVQAFEFDKLERRRRWYRQVPLSSLNSHASTDVPMSPAALKTCHAEWAQGPVRRNCFLYSYMHSPPVARCRFCRQPLQCWHLAQPAHQQMDSALHQKIAAHLSVAGLSVSFGRGLVRCS